MKPDKRGLQVEAFDEKEPDLRHERDQRQRHYDESDHTDQRAVTASGSLLSVKVFTIL